VISVTVIFIRFMMAEWIPSCDFVRQSMLLYLGIDQTIPTMAQEMYMHTEFHCMM